MTQRRQGYIPELQSLRGIAAVAVMIGHALNFYDTPLWFHNLSLIFNGRAAVVVFFVLSGYVLTRSLGTSSFDRASVVRFYVQRVFRIYPAIWAASAVGLWYLFALHWQIPVASISQGVQNQFRLDRFDSLHIIASFAGMLAFLLPQIWSIFVEIVASAAMPLVAFVIVHRPRWAPGMLAAAVIASYVVGQHTYYYFGLYFVDFVAGAMIAFPGTLKMPRSVRNWLVSHAPPQAAIALALFALTLTQYLPFFYFDPNVHIIETTLSAFVIASITFAKQPTYFLSSGLLVLIGDISYSIYLFHYVVICLLVKLFAITMTMSDSSGDIIFRSMTIAFTTCVLTVPLAWLSFEYIEKPGVRLGKILVRRWFRRAPLNQVASPPSDGSRLGFRG